MRVIAVGCEYSGVSTLIDALHKWGRERGENHHLDDHFTIPDAFHLSDEEQRAMLDMLPAIKERFQRFQIVYHVRLINYYEHILLGGFHIEEAVYGHRYYYPGSRQHVREYEPDMPDDAILVQLSARPEIIRKRMRAEPHPHQRRVRRIDDRAQVRDRHLRPHPGAAAGKVPRVGRRSLTHFARRHHQSGTAALRSARTAVAKGTILRPPYR